MLSFIPSKDMKTIALEFQGEATEEDSAKLDKAIQEKFDDKGEFNIYAVVYDVDGSTFKGLTEGMKVDMKRWKQYNKFAVVSEVNWLEKMVQLDNVLPGIEAEYFEMDEMEKAWDWIKS